jgi:hypothetical protein
LNLLGLRDHLARQVACFEAYFSTEGADGKTSKVYRKNIEEARARLAVVENILLDGYTPERHSSAVTNDITGEVKP